MSTQVKSTLRIGSQQVVDEVHKRGALPTFDDEFSISDESPAELNKAQEAQDNSAGYKKTAGAVMIIAGAVIAALAVMGYLNPHSFPTWFHNAVQKVVDFLTPHGALAAEIGAGVLGLGFIAGGSTVIHKARNPEEEQPKQPEQPAIDGHTKNPYLSHL